MRANNPRLSHPLPLLAAAAILASACNPDLPTETTIGQRGTALARQSSVAYTSVALGLLPGDNQSRANAVNDAGEVVGYSCCSPNSRAFVTLGGVMTGLPGTSANALSISNGATRYVVGWAGSPSQPVRWTITGNTADNPSQLGLDTASWGASLGVNDAGEAVGHAGRNAALWDAAGTLTVVPTPGGFTRGEGRDINNTGEAVFVFSRNDAGWPNGIATGYLRLSNGELIALPSLSSGGISYANSLTELSGSLVQIAGTSYADPSSPRAVRWTVDIAARQIVSADVRSEKSHATAIAQGGGSAGFTEGRSNSLRTSAFRWQGNDLLPLDPPKGGKEGKAWGTSSAGRFVVGEAMVQLARQAVLWTMPSQ